MATTKTILVCIGERKRPLVLNEKEENDNVKKDLFDAIKMAFSDVLDEKPIKKAIIQIKSE